jgi:hypothetical protein
MYTRISNDKKIKYIYSDSYTEIKKLMNGLNEENYDSFILNRIIAHTDGYSVFMWNT